MNILNKAYPLDLSLKKNLRISLIIGGFIFLFLYVFQPVNVLFVETGFMDLKVSLAYGIVTFLVMMVFIYILPNYFSKTYDEEFWTVKKEIISFLMMVFFIALFNYLFTLFFFSSNFRINKIATAIQLIIPLFVSTFVIAIFPLIGLVFYKQNTMLKKYLAETKSINESLNRKSFSNFITIKGEGKNESIELNYKELLFIKSQGNYCEVYSETAEKPFLLRNSLVNIKKDLVETTIYKCHRSYLVNIDNVNNVSGNAQGLRLHFAKKEESVPVSRNLSKEIKELLLASHS